MSKDTIFGTPIFSIINNFYFILFIIMFSSCRPTSHTIKIACVGDSITYGAGMVNREKNAYPQQLQEMLGSHYQVKNFGVNGATLLKKGNLPYWKTTAYQEALSFNPDVVLLKLGTNDSKEINRSFYAEFKDNYRDMVQSFQQINPDIEIIVLLPIPSFLEDSISIWNLVIKDQISPMIREVAYEQELEMVDLYPLFANNPGLLPDKIHPSSLGASDIARRLYEAIVRPESELPLQFAEVAGYSDHQEASFYGYRMALFDHHSQQARIVSPYYNAPGYPWVWRARFFGHQPQTDIALLERGFHIVYCDVSGLYGNEQAIHIWNNFYQDLVNSGLSTKAVLEGMSRGGLIIYNWAVENPEKVSAIYADAPVLDGNSWPGGLGVGKGSPPDWEAYKEVHGIKSEDELNTFKGDPISQTQLIAEAGFPMLHVCGLADKVVPVLENTAPFAKAIKEHGGNIISINKPGVGHHPHSLVDPTIIVNFILKAENRKLNFAEIASPSSEYRNGAGWIAGSDWWDQTEEIDSLCQENGSVDILLLGNSITQGWGIGRNKLVYKPGMEAAIKSFKDYNVLSAGISGDRTQHLLWRVRNGNYEKCQPKAVVITIGVNNFQDDTAEEIYAGIQSIIAEAVVKFSEQTKFLLYGPLPTGLSGEDPLREKYQTIHRLIRGENWPSSVHYCSMDSIMINSDGGLIKDYFHNDGIHLHPAGYEVWATHISDQLQDLGI